MRTPILYIPSLPTKTILEKSDNIELVLLDHPWEIR